MRYNESFSPPTTKPSQAAIGVISAAGFGSKLPPCDAPIIMAVTNFDPAHKPEGTPNFVDIPDPEAPFIVRPPTIRTVAMRWPTSVLRDIDEL